MWPESELWAPALSGRMLEPSSLLKPAAGERMGRCSLGKTEREPSSRPKLPDSVRVGRSRARLGPSRLDLVGIAPACASLPKLAPEKWPHRGQRLVERAAPRVGGRSPKLAGIAPQLANVAENEAMPGRLSCADPRVKVGIPRRRREDRAPCMCRRQAAMLATRVGAPRLASGRDGVSAREGLGRERPQGMVVLPPAHKLRSTGCCAEDWRSRDFDDALH